MSATAQSMKISADRSICRKTSSLHRQKITSRTGMAVAGLAGIGLRHEKTSTGYDNSSIRKNDGTADNILLLDIIIVGRHPCIGGNKEPTTMQH